MISFSQISCLFQELRNSLQEKHIEDMHAQMSAHKATLESVKDQAERLKQDELKEQRVKHEQDKGKTIKTGVVFTIHFSFLPADIAQ